jgi:hypothetical protein
MSPTGAASSDSTPPSLRSTPQRRLLTAGDPMALPELDVAQAQRWCAVRVPEHARNQVRVECEVAPRHLTIVERRAPWREDFGPEWTSFPIARLRYTAADKTWTLLLARPKSSLPHLRATGSLAPSRRPPHRDRPRPHLHLLGVTPNADSRRFPARLRWSQLQPPQWGQFELTSPTSPDLRRRKPTTVRGLSGP